MEEEGVGSNGCCGLFWSARPTPRRPLPSHDVGVSSTEEDASETKPSVKTSSYYDNADEREVVATTRRRSEAIDVDESPCICVVRPLSFFGYFRDIIDDKGVFNSREKM